MPSLNEDPVVVSAEELSLTLHSYLDSLINLRSIDVLDEHVGIVDTSVNVSPLVEDSTAAWCVAVTCRLCICCTLTSLVVREVITNEMVNNV